jgi:hypothetical protein
MRFDAMKVALLAATSILVGGCFGGLNRAINSYEEEVDISTIAGAQNVAVISGNTETIILLSCDCWISHPANAKRLIIDPGLVHVGVSCDCTQNPVQTSYFTFEAVAGHKYKHNMGWSCNRIVDTKNKQTVADTCDKEARIREEPPDPLREQRQKVLEEIKAKQE